jgi:arabinose-5-phosphate isomerase
MIDHFERTLTIICNAVHSIRADEFNKLKNDCNKTLSTGNKIITSGLGKNVPICEKFVGTLHSLGIAASFMHTNSAVHGDLGMIRDGDLVIVLSKSGETSESIYLVELLKKRNCKIWLLSFNRESTLYKEISEHLVIDLEHEGDPWNILPNNSTVLNLIVLQELAMQIVKEHSIGIDVLRMNHPGGAIGMKLSESPMKFSRDTNLISDIAE